MPLKNETTIVAEPGKQEVFITREFEAPCRLVFKAFTTAELLSQWLGPKKHSMEVEVYNAVTGGRYRYVHVSPDGHRYWFRGSFHEVAEPERTIQTFEYEGLPEKGHVALETARFEALPGNRTRVTIQSVFQSVSDRNGMVMAGMERGVREGHERLDELLAKDMVK